MTEFLYHAPYNANFQSRPPGIHQVTGLTYGTSAWSEVLAHASMMLRLFYAVLKADTSVKLLLPLVWNAAACWAGTCVWEEIAFSGCEATMGR